MNQSLDWFIRLWNKQLLSMYFTLNIVFGFKDVLINEIYRFLFLES